MLLSRNLLNKINPNFSLISDNDLIAALNAIGVEVESAVKNNVNNSLKLGRLISFKKHPDSDHLNICDVVVDEKKVEIVCGASNLESNQWVVVASPGCEIQPGVTIENREIRGVWSHGMLCSLKEILTSMTQFISEKDSDGIIQIPYHYKLNPDTFFDEYGFNDTIFDLSLPSNRPELNGLYFLANELNLQFNFTTKLPKDPLLSKFTNLFKKHPDILTINTDYKIAYHLLDLKLTPSIENIWKLKMVLINSGIKVQDNHSDFASLLTILFAQPTFCLDKQLVGDKLYVCELDNESEFVDANNKLHKLHKGTIVTKNANDEIVTVTGMYLSKNFVSNYEHNDVYLEIANLPLEYISKINELNEHNDNLCSYYLKSPADNVAKIIVNWIQSKKNFSVQLIDSSEIISTTKFYGYKIIYFSLNKLLKLLGTRVRVNQLAYLFHKIDVIFLGYKVLVPAYRKDLSNVTDLAEEILKAIDINKLNGEPIQFKINDFKQNKQYQDLTKVRNYLINKQFFEVKTYNLTSPKVLDNYNWFGIDTTIEIKNPIVQDRKVLRKNLVHEMLNVLSYNNQHKQESANIFEIQKIQFSDTEANDILCSLLTTNIFSNPIDKSLLHADVYTNKALYEGLEDTLGFKLRKKFNVTNFSNVYDVNNFALFDKDNNLVGFVGQIKQHILNKEYKLNYPVYVICLNLSLALKQPKPTHTFWKVSDLNPIYKDITFSNPEQVDLKDINRKLLEIPMITKISLTDVFEKDAIKSYTITIKIQPQNKNLTNDEINQLFQNAIITLRNQKLVVKE